MFAIKRSRATYRYLLAILTVSCVPVFAETISLQNFSSMADLTLRGSAKTVKTQDGTVVRLTEARCCAAGSVFSKRCIPFLYNSNSFSTFFQFRITDPGGINPADRIVSVLQARNKG